jgi:hypothetical protein
VVKVFAIVIFRALLKIFVTRLENPCQLGHIGVTFDLEPYIAKLRKGRRGMVPEKELKELKKTSLGCLGLLGVVVIIFTLFSACTGGEEEEFNPYTEDYDGDGIGGTSDDHDILHEMPTMPDGE